MCALNKRYKPHRKLEIGELRCRLDVVAPCLARNVGRRLRAIVLLHRENTCAPLRATPIGVAPLSDARCQSRHGVSDVLYFGLIAGVWDGQRGVRPRRQQTLASMRKW